MTIFSIVVSTKALFQARKVYIPVFAYLIARIVMSKKLSKTRLASTNRDIHVIFNETCPSKWEIENKCFDEFEARRASKLEASKPLRLVRA